MFEIFEKTFKIRVINYFFRYIYIGYVFNTIFLNKIRVSKSELILKCIFFSGQGCSMEQMEAIRDQQESLAKLHFDLGGKQDPFAPLSEEGNF